MRKLCRSSRAGRARIIVSRVHQRFETVASSGQRDTVDIEGVSACVCAVGGGVGVLMNAPYVDVSNKWGGGGLLSTARDLAAFGHAMLTHQILQPYEKPTSVVVASR